MKKIILTTISTIVVTTGANAQYIDNVSSFTGSGLTWTSFNNPVTGNLQIQYSNTGWGYTPGPNYDWASTLSFEHSNSGNNDVVAFSWQNAVTSFEFTIWDWDGGGVNPGVFKFAGVDRVTVLGVGDAIYNDPGYSANTYTTVNNKITYDMSLANITNSDPGVGLRIRLDNSNGAAFSSFNMQLIQGLSYNGFGGPTPSGFVPVPEPSSAALLGLGGLGLLIRRKRA